MKKLLALLTILTFTSVARAQNIEPPYPEGPGLEFVCELRVNCGLITMTRGENGAPGFYFRTAPKFEAPQDSPYDWLNNAIFVCMPGPATDCIYLRVWKVLSIVDGRTARRK